MSNAIIILFIVLFFCVSLYCTLVLYKWRLFKKLKKDDKFGEFIDYDYTVGLRMHTVVNVEENELGETIKVYTDEDKSFTFMDYIKDNIKLLEEYSN